MMSSVFIILRKNEKINILAASFISNPILLRQSFDGCRLENVLRHDYWSKRLNENDDDGGWGLV